MLYEVITKQQLKDMSDALPLAIFQIRQNQNFEHWAYTYASAKCKDILGIDPGELLMNYQIMDEKLHPDDKPLIIEKIETALRDKTDFEFEHRVITSYSIHYTKLYELIGTTDLEYKGDIRKVQIDQDEVQYLCDVVNKHFIHQISPADVVWSYSGVRPLCDDESSSPQAVTRDYTLELEDDHGKAPLLSVFGGKLTTYRKLAQAACHKLAPYFPQAHGDWTSTTVLPGGKFEGHVLHLTQRYRKLAPWLDGVQARRIRNNFV